MRLLSEELRNSLLQQMYGLTCTFMDTAVKEDNVSIYNLHDYIYTLNQIANIH